MARKSEIDTGYDRWGCQGQGHKPGEGTTGTDGSRYVLHTGSKRHPFLNTGNPCRR